MCRNGGLYVFEEAGGSLGGFKSRHLKLHFLCSEVFKFDIFKGFNGVFCSTQKCGHLKPNSHFLALP